MKHSCKSCDFETTILSKYIRHIQTDKHKLKIQSIKKEEETIKKIELMETNVINNINKVKKEISNEADKNNKKITAKIEEVKKIANKNREYAKSTLTILNELYKDNPPLEYPGDRQCLTALYEYYKLTRIQVLNTNKLQKALVKDFSKGTLIDSIIKILTPFLKKENIHLQSIYNTDVTRNSYAAKYNNSWEKDKSGVYLNEKVVKPFCSIINALMINYKKYKSDRYVDYKKKLLNKYNDNDSDDNDSNDIFMNATDTETEFAYKDDTSDEEKRGLDELDEYCSINNLGRFIESGQLHDEIITKLSLILNYNVRIKNYK